MEMRKLLFAILLLSLAFAKTVAVEEFELDNKSEIHSFTGTIVLHCENKTVGLFLYDSKPIDNASVFLMYEYGVLSNDVTDNDGRANLQFVGNYKFMTKLFQLRIDKPTYKKMLISFDVDECKEGAEGFYIMHELETFTPPKIEQNESEEAAEENVSGETEKPESKLPVVKVVEKDMEKEEEGEKAEERPCAAVGLFALISLAFIGAVGCR